MLASVVVGALGLDFENSLGFFLGISSIVFYAAGFVWAKSGIRVNAPEALACLLISVAAFFLCGEMDVHTMTYPLYPLNVLGAVAATFFLFWILQKLSGFTRFMGALAFCGRWSLLLLGVHYVEFMLFDWHAKFPGEAVVVLRLAADILATLGLSRLAIVKKIFSADTRTRVRSKPSLR